MITLITGQPGNGKTALAVWQYIREAIAQGRVVYTLGIPKLKLPCVPLSRNEMAKWHECHPKKNPDDEDEVPVLKNIDEGSLLVVDEAQKLWKPQGTTSSPDIDYLSEHRHHGLDFVIMTQYPFLVHRNVRALVTKHIHIRSTWLGKSLNEWPDWQEHPHTRSVIADSVKTRYNIPPAVFPLYESASIHTKVKHRTPLRFYLTIGVFILLPIMAYWSYSRIMIRAHPNQPDKSSIFNTAIAAGVGSHPGMTQPVAVASVPVVGGFENVNLVSNRYDWSKVAGCVVFKSACTCYGDSGEHLVIPLEACTAAVKNGWSGRELQQPVKQVPAEATRHEEHEQAPSKIPIELKSML